MYEEKINRRKYLKDATITLAIFAAMIGVGACYNYSKEKMLGI